jgi:hypothetical protein
MKKFSFSSITTILLIIVICVAFVVLISYFNSATQAAVLFTIAFASICLVISFET